MVVIQGKLGAAVFWMIGHGGGEMTLPLIFVSHNHGQRALSSRQPRFYGADAFLIAPSL